MTGPVEPDDPNPFASPEVADAPEAPYSAPEGAVPFLTPRTAVVPALWINALFSVLTIAGQIYQLAVINQPDPAMETLERSDLITQSVASLSLLSLLAAVITWGMWVHRAASNLRAMQPHARFEFTPGSQVWWFFVPFANLVKPLHGMREIWTHTKLALEDFGLDEPPLSLWWGLWVTTNILSNIAFRIVPSADSAMSQSSYFERLSLASVAQILAEGASIAAVAVAVRIILAFNGAQGRWARKRAA